MAALQKLAEWFLGIPPAEPGQGMEWRYAQSFPWPAWGVLLFAVLAVVYVAGVYRRDAAHLSRRARLGLTALRLASLVVLLFMLSQAILSVERTGLPYVLVMLDTSGSMATEDLYSQAAMRSTAARMLKQAQLAKSTRLNLGKALLLRNDGEFLKRLVQDHKLRVYTVAEAEGLLGSGDYLRPEAIDGLLPEIRKLQPRGEQTRLGDAVRRVLVGLRGTPPSAIVLITDGVVTDGEKLSQAARYARQKSVPLLTVAVGNPDPTRDVELHDVLADEVAFVDDPVTFSFKLTGRGYSGKKSRVVLRLKGQDEPLAAREFELGPDGAAQRLELTFTPKAVGDFDYVLEALALPKETNVKNNKEMRRVSIRKERIRVLLVDSLPRWEFRELKVLLEREKSVELKTVLQDADPEYSQEDRSALPHFPVKKDDLFHYDVVVLGDVNLSYLSGSVLDNLREFVREKGGGLLLIAGPSFNPAAYGGTPLETLLPIELAGLRLPADTALIESFHPELTVEGAKGSSIFRFADGERESQEVWNQLPGFYWMVEAPVLKPGALALATHPLRTGSSGKLPVVAMQRFGAGKVMFHASDETWRWRFRTGDLYYGRYWVQVMRYLSRSKLLGKDRTAELTVDRRVYKTGDDVELRLRFVDEKLAPSANNGVTIVIERPGEAQRKVVLNRLPESPTVFEGQVSQLAEGTYHAWVAAPAFSEAPPSQDFKVESPARETRLLQTDAEELRRAASLTPGGKHYTVFGADQILNDIPPGLPAPLETDKPIQLWNHWLTLGLFVGLLCTEWILRKRLRLL